MLDEKKVKSFEEKSGIEWSTINTELLKIKDEGHANLAKKALEILNKKSNMENKEWWAQNVAVIFEKANNLRVTGQTCNGDFQVSVSKTVNVSMDEALSLWIKNVEGKYEFNGVKIISKARISQSQKWRYWKIDLEDKSTINVNITEKVENEKSSISINHDKIQNFSDIEIYRSFWKTFLKTIK